MIESVPFRAAGWKYKFLVGLTGFLKKATHMTYFRNYVHPCSPGMGSLINTSVEQIILNEFHDQTHNRLFSTMTDILYLKRY